MKYNFPRKKRLLEEKQFKLVFSKAKRMFSDEVRIFFCPNKLGYSRAGVIVSKKNISLATKRNSFKRVVREFCRINQHKLGSLDIVVLINKKGMELDKKGLYQVLDKQFSRLIND